MEKERVVRTAALPKSPEQKKPLTTTAGSTRSTVTSRTTPMAPTRTSALSSRTTGSTITKPPTRPPSGTLTSRPPTSLADENKRPPRTSTVGVSARTSAKPDSITETPKRASATSTATTSTAPRRPLVSSRTTVSSPATARPASRTATARVSSSTTPGRTSIGVTATRTTSDRAVKAPATVRSPTKVKPVPPRVSDSIPEEHEAASTDAQPAASEESHAPPKLEIRSQHTPTKVLKPRADSDAELELRPRNIARHARTQSANVTRPSTAPSQSEQEQNWREIEVIQKLLKESTARDALAAENKDLRMEIQALETRNKKLAAEIKADPSYGSNTGREIERLGLEKLIKQHEEELQELKDSHATLVSVLKASHASEISSVRSELDKHRRQDSQLGEVENKIYAVEEALRDSKEQASQNERDLVQTIEDLRLEIDQCQKKLDEDALKQEKEKSDAKLAAETLQQQLNQQKDLVQKYQLDADENLAKHEAELTEITTAREALERDLAEERAKSQSISREAQIKTAASVAEAEAAQAALKQQLDDERAEHQSAIERLKSDSLAELADARNDHLRTTGAEAEKFQKMEEQYQTLRGEHEQLQGSFADLQRQQDDDSASQNVQIETHEKAAIEAKRVIDELRDELVALQQREASASQDHAKSISDIEERHKASADAADAAESTIESLRTELNTLNNQVEESTKRVQSLEESLRHAEEELRTQTERTMLDQQASEQDTRETSSLVEKLEGELESLRTIHAKRLQSQEDDLTKSRNLVLELQEEIQNLKKTHHDVLHEKQEIAEQTDTAIKHLQDEIQTLQQQRNREQDEANERLASLQDVVKELTHQCENFKNNERDGDKTVEGLQDEVRTLQELCANMEAKNSQDIDSLNQVVDKLQSECGNLQQMHQDALATKDAELDGVQQAAHLLQDKIAALQQELDQTTQAKAAAEKRFEEELASVRHESAIIHDEIVVAKDRENNDLRDVIIELQNSIQREQQLAEENNAGARELQEGHAIALRTLQDELETKMQTIHDVQAAHEVSKEEISQVERLFEALTAEHEVLRSTHKATTDSNAETASKILNLTEALAAAEEAKRTADELVSAAREEMNGLHKVLETFSQDATEKEADHKRITDALRQELVVAKAKNDAATQETSLLSSMKKDHEAIFAEKAVLEKRLADITIQHNREMEEESTRHETAYSELQTKFAQTRDAQMKNMTNQDKEHQRELQSLRDASEGQKVEHEQGLEELRNLHRRALDELEQKYANETTELRDEINRITNEQTRQTNSDDVIAALKEGHNSALERDRAEHKVRLEEIAARHAKDLDASKYSAASEFEAALAESSRKHAEELKALKRAAESDREAALAERSTRHAEELEKVKQAAASDREATLSERMSAHARELSEVKKIAAVELDAMLAERAKSHAEETNTYKQVAASELNAALAERSDRHAKELVEYKTKAASDLATALAAKDEAHATAMSALETKHAELARSHPPYTGSEHDAKDLQQRGNLSHIFVNHETKHSSHEYMDINGASNLSQKEVEMKAKATMESLDAMKIENEHLRERIKSLNADLVLVKEQAYDMPAAVSFKMSHTGAGVMDDKDPFGPRPTSQPSNQEHDRTTLEGTLEIMRVQTEQLLELNEDFIMESRRWSQKFGTRSARNSPQVKVKRRSVPIVKNLASSESVGQSLPVRAAS